MKELKMYSHLLKLKYSPKYEKNTKRIRKEYEKIQKHAKKIRKNTICILNAKLLFKAFRSKNKVASMSMISKYDI